MRVFVVIMQWMIVSILPGQFRAVHPVAIPEAANDSPMEQLGLREGSRDRRQGGAIARRAGDGQQHGCDRVCGVGSLHRKSSHMLQNIASENVYEATIDSIHSIVTSKQSEPAIAPGPDGNGAAHLARETDAEVIPGILQWRQVVCLRQIQPAEPANRAVLHRRPHERVVRPTGLPKCLPDQAENPCVQPL